ncbi:hypothetical protein DRQ21_09665 [Candidatus Fermentibacteria bacterium]|nr:MAG: hypothetical protein DRQ21_09665 [Candidatus Fermentibacteria bacterium]
MTLILIVSILAGLPSGDGAIVMLPGVPVHPWAALSDTQLEEMWTYGIQGYQVTRSGWSGYIISGPEGSAQILEQIAETLETDSIMADSSLWARTIQLVWNTNAMAGSWIVEDSFEGAPVLPVRTSRWLEAGEDTLIVSLPIENSVFLWGGARTGENHLTAWRGVGTEVIPDGASAVNVLVTCSVEGSPGDIMSLEYTPSEQDNFWGERWAPLLCAADSLVLRQMSGGLVNRNSLVWIRGTGGQTFCPWSMVPSPSPPAVASVEVEAVPGMIPYLNTGDIPGILSVPMPGNAGSGARAAYAAALLERIVSRMALPSGALCSGVSSEDGSVVLQITGVDWSRQTALEIIKDELTPIIFTSPEYQLLNNAAVKAGIPEMNQQDTITLLAKVTGFLN